MAPCELGEKGTTVPRSTRSLLTYTTKASGKSTNGSLGLVVATVPPGGGPVAHAHTRTDEAFYVRSGALEIEILPEET